MNDCIFQIVIRSAEVLNSRYNNGIYIKYNVKGEQEVQTQTVQGTLKPQFNYCQTVTFPTITEQHLDFFENGCITFFVYGIQKDIPPDVKLSKLSTKVICFSSVHSNK